MEEEDEEVVLKGSALYNYLRNEGYDNFQSIQPNSSNSIPLCNKQDNLKTPSSAPKWVSDHLQSILKCGLLLDDHFHFVECFLPLHTYCESSRYTRMLCGFSWISSLGSFLYISRHSVSSRCCASLCVLSSLATIYFTQTVCDLRLQSESLKKLCLMLDGLESLLIQFKRMVSLVQQNELIIESFALHSSEMTELRTCVWRALDTSIKTMWEFFAKIKEVPLIHDIDATLQTLSSEDIACFPDDVDEKQLSMESLKRLYNTYILIQSEFLRRLALCLCPELWSKDTFKKIKLYSKTNFVKVNDWSRKCCLNLVEKHKLFRAIRGSRGKTTQLRMSVSTGWVFSDLYVAVRSASLHLQSLLIQTHDIEHLLESKETGNLNKDREFLCNLAQILSGIQKELRSCQICFDDSLIQVLKMTNSIAAEVKMLSPLECVPNCDTSLEPPDSELNPPVEDEVFELIVPFEGVDGNLSDEDSDETDRQGRSEESDASKRVLQELKVVLVKKADEWKERERKAMESKGMVHNIAEQVGKDNELKEYSAGISPVDCNLLQASDIQWPLPRLKGTISTHRLSGNRNRRPFFEVQLQPSDLRRARAEEMREASQHTQPKPGFEPSLLAEAIQKSKKMNLFKTEDVFLDSGDEDDMSS